jgi:hypothetical protein
MIRAVEPAPHEFSGNLIFTDNGLDPFFALDATVDAGGSQSGQIDVDGQTYDIQLDDQESGLKPRGDDPEFRIETVREFRIKFEAIDETGCRSGAFHVKPRWPDMESEGDGPDPSTPADITGVNVRVDASNLQIDTYPRLLRAAMQELGINQGYFLDDKIHEYSNIFAYELYTRINREQSDMIVANGGPLEQIMEHVRTESDFRELREDNGQIDGYHNRVVFDSDGAGTLIDGHTIGKKVKHYHPKEVRDDPTDPLYHPKLGVSMKRNRTHQTVRWSDRHQLQTELDELLINILSWSGLSTRPSRDTYISDSYFTAIESKRDLRLIDNPLPTIKRKQEAVVIDGLTGNPDLNHSDRECLELVADGGQVDIDRLADQTDYSPRTIYRVVDRLDDLLTTLGGSVGFVSEFVQDTVRTTLSDIEDTLTSTDGATDSSSSFQKWVNAHGVETETEDGRLILRFGRVPAMSDMREVCKAGLRAWQDSGNDPKRFRFGKAVYTQSGTPRIRDRILR